MTPLKAIRAKCLDCCCSQANEVKLCEIQTCPLWEYRTGHGKSRKELTEEQKAQRRILLQKAREKLSKNQATA